MYSLTVFEVKSLKWSLKSKCQWGCTLSGGSRKNLLPYFSGFYKRACGPFLHLQSQQGSMFESLSLSPTLLLTSASIVTSLSPYKDSCDYNRQAHPDDSR